MKEKINYISTLSVISALAVVILHTNGCFWDFSTERYWASANAIESIMYFAVPVFFMISGATLVEYRERYTTKDFFKKRISKTLIPFLIFSVFGLIFQIIIGNVAVGDLSVFSIINGIMNVEYNGTYWFFFPLFGVYLCIPLFAAVPKELRQSIFKYLAVVCFIFNTVLPFICYYLPISYNTGLTVRVGSSYVFYIIVGYLLHTNTLKKGYRVVIYLLGIAGLFTHLYGTYHLSMEAGHIVETYKGYNNLPTILYSIAVFVFVKHLPLPKFVNRIVNFISPYTFSIYLMHWYFIVFAEGYLNVDELSIVWRLFGVIPIALICIIIASIVRKIPFGSKLLP